MRRTRSSVLLLAVGLLATAVAGICGTATAPSAHAATAAARVAAASSPDLQRLAKLSAGRRVLVFAFHPL